MTYGTRVFVYGLLLLAELSLVFVATLMNSAIPLFFGFIPALVIMQIEKRATSR